MKPVNLDQLPYPFNAKAKALLAAQNFLAAHQKPAARQIAESLQASLSPCIPTETEDPLARALLCECEGEYVYTEYPEGRDVKTSHYCLVHDMCDYCGEALGVCKGEMEPLLCVPKGRRSWLCLKCSKACTDCGAWEGEEHGLACRKDYTEEENSAWLDKVSRAFDRAHGESEDPK